MVVVPELRNDEVIAAIQTTARTRQAGEDKMLVFAPSSAPLAFAAERLRKHLGKP
jgi:hypothetical protein